MFGTIKGNARIRIKALNLRILHEKYDKHLLKKEPRGQNLLRHEERLINGDGVLMLKYYGEDGRITHYQVIIPKHLVPDYYPHFTARQTNTPNLIQESRTKYYYPRLARKISAWVNSCPDCITNKRIYTRYIRPKLLSNTEFTMGPENCLEVDILQNLPSSNGYQYIITMRAFSHVVFLPPHEI